MSEGIIKNKKLIYLIDDEESIRFFSEKLLLKKFDNICVKMFESCNDALAEFKKRVPNLIITDYNRFNDCRSTLDFLEIIKMDSRGEKPKIFLVSGGREMTKNVRHFVDGYLNKPFNIQEWLAIVSDLLFNDSKSKAKR